MFLVLRPSYGVKNKPTEEQHFICVAKLGRQEATLKSQSEEVDPKLL